MRPKPVEQALGKGSERTMEQRDDMETKERRKYKGGRERKIYMENSGKGKEMNAKKEEKLR